MRLTRYIMENSHYNDESSHYIEDLFRNYTLLINSEY